MKATRRIARWGWIGLILLGWSSVALGQSSAWPQSQSQPQQSTWPSSQPARPNPAAQPAAWSTNWVVPQARAFLPQRAVPMAKGGWQTRQPPVEIASVDVRVEVLDQLATTRLDVRLRNPAGFGQQAELLLPVVAGVVVRGFEFAGSARAPSAQLLPAAEARRIYAEIVKRARDPALLEFVGLGLIRSSLFPVPAGGEQKIRLIYEELLPSVADRVDYWLPRSESLDQGVAWNMAVRLRSGRPIATVYSPTHELEVLRRGAGDLDVRIPLAAQTPGPLRLSWLFQHDDGVSASAYTCPDPDGGGAFLFLAGPPSPPAGAPKTPGIPRELTLVLDRSGSMNGEKLEQVRQAALRVIGALADGERFNLIVYNEAVDPFSARPVVKDADSLARARAWLAAVRSSGGTNLHDALAQALTPKPARGMLPIVLFLTDGLPTVGQTSERAIRNLVTQKNPYGRRIFTFGVGVDVNTPLLSAIASRTRGQATFVLPGEDLQTQWAQGTDGLRGPVLADPRLAVFDATGRPARDRISELLPERLPDLFAGDRLVLLGRYRGQQPLIFELSGNFLGSRRSFRTRVDPARATVAHTFVLRLWASRKIASLIDAIRATGADADRLSIQQAQAASALDPGLRRRVDQVVRLSREYGILTEYTAFLAGQGAGREQADQVQAQAERNFEQRAVQVRSGLGSINQDFNKQAQAAQAVLNPTNAYFDANMQRVSSRQVQQLADRAFFRRADAWVDSRLADRSAAGPVREVEFGTDEFWRLVDRLAREGRQGSIALHGPILLQVDGRAVLVRNPVGP